MTYDEIVQFHGHECPGLAIGYRMATAAMETLESFRAEDEELVAIVENDACGVDALQCVTGCTFGKGNLLFRDYGKHVYTIYCRSSRLGVRVRIPIDSVCIFTEMGFQKVYAKTETPWPIGLCQHPMIASFL